MSGGVPARVRAVLIEIMRRNPWLRTRVRTARRVVRGVLFRAYSAGRPDRRLIVFESFVGRSYAGSPRALYEAMLADPRFADCRFVWALRHPGYADDFGALADPRTTIVPFGSGVYHRAFGRAKVWISNSTIAAELVPRPSQVYVQTWHGTGIKKIGYDIVATTGSALNNKHEIEERYRLEAAKISLFVTPAPFGTTVFSSAFALPASGPASPFVELGNPRNDPLVRATADDVAAARSRLGVPEGARTVLYAPTFRDDRYDARTGYVDDRALDLDAFVAALREDDIVLFRAHYLIAAASGLDRHSDRVFDVSGVEDVNEVLLAADVLVTDYSSMCFDYMLLDRPAVFYMYDLDRFGTDLRGFYFPVEDMPGPIVRTQDELVEVLLDPDLPQRDEKRRREVREWMTPHDDGHVCERVLDLLHERMAAA